MVEFQTIKAEEKKFGTNNFIEVARKKAITDQGENEFTSISRGFFAQDGTKRFKTSLTIPSEVIDFVCENLQEMKGEESAPAEAPAEEPASE